MTIRPQTLEKLKARMEKLNVREEDFEEAFIKGSGKGGQKINTSSSCVFLKHPPSGFEVKCQKSRSREENRYFARERLIEKIEEKILGEKSKIRQEIEKIRRRKQKRSKRSQEKMLKEKKLRSQVKEGRKPHQAGE